MKILTLIIITGILFLQTLTPAAAQKKVSELSLVYDYSIGNIGNATHTVYIKGSKSRSEVVSQQFSSTTIYDASTGLGVILKEVSGQKLLIRMNPDNWKERNKLFEGIEYKPTGETKEIAGYKCQKAIGQTKTGATITVYYTRDLLPENKDYDPTFHNLEGLPLEFQLAFGNQTLAYKISKISLNPVPASKFDIPKSGYREMNYEESKKVN
jgi:hypothetical protein